MQDLSMALYVKVSQPGQLFEQQSPSAVRHSTQRQRILGAVLPAPVTAQEKHVPEGMPSCAEQSERLQRTNALASEQWGAAQSQPREPCNAGADASVRHNQKNESSRRDGSTCARRHAVLPVVPRRGSCRQLDERRLPRPPLPLGAPPSSPLSLSPNVQHYVAMPLPGGGQ